MATHRRRSALFELYFLTLTSRLVPPTIILFTFVACLCSARLGATTCVIRSSVATSMRSNASLVAQKVNYLITTFDRLLVYLDCLKTQDFSLRVSSKRS